MLKSLAQSALGLWPVPTNGNTVFYRTIAYKKVYTAILF